VYVLETRSLVRRLLAGGMSERAIVEQLTLEIAARGGASGKYMNAVNSSAQSYIFRVADRAMQDAFEARDIQNNMRWVTFFARSCPDCISRHGRVQSYTDWQSEGLPRSGATVCRSHCHCVLVPDDYPTRISAPILRRESAIREEVREERRQAREARAAQ